VAEAGDGDLAGGSVPVTVGLEDDRRVVAELEADLFTAGLGLELPTNLARAGEGDQSDVGVLDDGVPDGASAAGDDVEVAGR